MSQSRENNTLKPCEDTVLNQFRLFMAVPLTQIIEKFLQNDRKAEEDLMTRLGILNLFGREMDPRYTDRFSLYNQRKEFAQWITDNFLEKNKTKPETLTPRECSLLGLYYIYIDVANNNSEQTANIYFEASKEYDGFAALQVGLGAGSANKPIESRFGLAHSLGVISAGFYLCLFSENILQPMRAAAEKGSRLACEYLGKQYPLEEKNGIAKGQKSAVTYYEDAAKIGSVTALSSLGDIYENQAKKIRRGGNNKSAVRWENLIAKSAFYFRVATQFEGFFASRLWSLCKEYEAIPDVYYHAAICFNKNAVKPDDVRSALYEEDLFSYYHQKVKPAFNLFRKTSAQAFYDLCERSGDTLETIRPVVAFDEEEYEAVRLAFSHIETSQMPLAIKKVMLLYLIPYRDIIDDVVTKESAARVIVESEMSVLPHNLLFFNEQNPEQMSAKTKKTLQGIQEVEQGKISYSTAAKKMCSNP